ncbi:MAG: elongation factor P [Deltaproteobacteria bacterium]|nr:elongation factor P [Deltaproteobacteria bacterium]
MTQASRLRVGSVVIFEKELCRVLSTNHHTPGNLRAMVQMKMRQLKDGVQFEHRFRATEDVEPAYLEEHEMDYLYQDGDRYHLMNSATFEQIEADSELFGDAGHFILPNTKVKVTFYEGKPVGLALPQTVDLKVTEADPAIKRQTASSSYKRAILETGFAVQVPPFVEVGDVVRINTESGEYLERVSK